jgi:hypothetical protein
MLARHDRAEGPGLHGGKKKGEKFLCCMTRYLLRMTAKFGRGMIGLF